MFSRTVHIKKKGCVRASALLRYDRENETPCIKVTFYFQKAEDDDILFYEAVIQCFSDGRSSVMAQILLQEIPDSAIQAMAMDMNI